MAGEILKQRREALGLDLREISNTLRIKYAYLKALEDGDMKNLPPEVYVKGYIHEYARVLNINPDPVISAYMQLIAQPDPSQDKPAGETTQSKKRKTGYVLIPALLILAALFLIYLQKPSTTKTAESPVPAVEPEKEMTPAAESVPQRTMSGHLLQINAHDTTWLQVMIDKTEPKELLMQPGDAAEWRAEKCFSLKIGNAGGVKLRFDGKSLANLGDAGQVVTINLPASGT
ncbi:MAG: helix-turn-helix domain-containing protein [Nitrospirales bacterium]|nr:MAG: helix-turn-helix domain-containing protein [Nitrospirales bacterium]